MNYFIFLMHFKQWISFNVVFSQEWNLKLQLHSQVYDHRGVASANIVTTDFNPLNKSIKKS